ncbi:hypothetical protein [Methanonatronarchaeum sp. AMET6-2]|uniref:hypothetical protein n=1 Tax=Methanonatronarchaeum sp. AMET6-2 TaxID=2933293 RepID=UPI001FF25B3F|nr:hypothetical protein [Methanonatronarchaeum sp. AMET6-2]UOY09907.1 hypothetical protein MU439_06515 [Methanonatronarchaeum sp. AMET6-2]
MEYLKSRFKIPDSIFDELEVFEKNDIIWISSEKDVPGDYEVETEGVKMLIKTKNGYRPTSYGLQLLNDKISGSHVEVNKEELKSLLDGGLIEKTPANISHGYIAIMYRNRVLGCGFYKNNLVSSRIPKKRSRDLKRALIK